MALAEDLDEGLVFIVAADMRKAATGEFSNVCKAIGEVGQGVFMISPGDLDADPPSATREMLNAVLGEDYPWYPVLGNHDPESPSTMRYLRSYNKTLPHVVNRGPQGCEATTYSFDWGD
ncbi:MAG: metallophosphatase family protein, partial [Acidobacteria bacterium]|nr:metallophosphatase family protein [Acidobacteriota bacterium]